MTISIQQHQRDIAQLQAEQRYEITPNIERLNQRVAITTAQATLDPGLRGELQVALNDLRQGQATIAANKERAARIRQLQHELTEAEQQARMAAIELANNALANANAEYLAAGKTLIRAYRRLLIQQRRSQHTPGAKTAIPSGFNFAPANPAGWDGFTSDMMRSGPLPFEQREQEREAS